MHCARQASLISTGHPLVKSMVAVARKLVAIPDEISSMRFFIYALVSSS